MSRFSKRSHAIWQGRYHIVRVPKYQEKKEREAERRGFDFYH